MKYYKILSILTSILFLFLSFQLLFTPEAFIKGVGVEPCLAAVIAARRTAMFMLGIVFLMFGARNLQPSKARQIICLAIAITMLGLASMGSFELIRGTVNASMYQAISIESIIGISFIILLIKNRNVITKS